MELIKSLSLQVTKWLKKPNGDHGRAQLGCGEGSKLPQDIDGGILVEPRVPDCCSRSIPALYCCLKVVRALGAGPPRPTQRSHRMDAEGQPLEKQATASTQGRSARLVPQRPRDPHRAAEAHTCRGGRYGMRGTTVAEDVASQGSARLDERYPERPLTFHLGAPPPKPRRTQLAPRAETKLPAPWAGTLPGCSPPGT